MNIMLIFKVRAMAISYWPWPTSISWQTNITWVKIQNFKWEFFKIIRRAQSYLPATERNNYRSYKTKQ